MGREISLFSDNVPDPDTGCQLVPPAIFNCSKKGTRIAGGIREGK